MAPWHRPFDSRETGLRAPPREGIMAARVTASVGNPVTLSAYVQDRGNRGDYPEAGADYFPLGTEWVMHQGPVASKFRPRSGHRA